MIKFTDKNDTEWTFDITLGVRNRVRAQTGVDFFDTMSAENCIAKLANPDTLGSVLWVMLLDQCRSRNILEPEGLFNLLDGAALDRAVNALVDAVVFFSPPLIKPAIEKGVERGRAAEKRVGEMIRNNLDKIGSQIDSALMGSSDSVMSSPVLLRSETRSHGRSAGSRGKRKGGKRTSGAARRRS